MFIKETVKQHENEKHTPGDWRTERYIFTHTGELPFELTVWSDGPTRKRWGDTKGKTVEDRYGAIVAGIVFHHETLYQEHLLREIQKKKREDEMKQAAEAEELRRLESIKTNQLITDANNWQQAALIRQYVVKLEANRGPSDYVKWALNKADELDPTINNS